MKTMDTAHKVKSKKSPVKPGSGQGNLSSVKPLFDQLGSKDKANNDIKKASKSDSSVKTNSVTSNKKCQAVGRSQSSRSDPASSRVKITSRTSSKQDKSKVETGLQKPKKKKDLKKAGSHPSLYGKSIKNIIKSGSDESLIRDPHGRSPRHSPVPFRNSLTLNSDGHLEPKHASVQMLKVFHTKAIVPEPQVVLQDFCKDSEEELADCPCVLADDQRLAERAIQTLVKRQGRDNVCNRTENTEEPSSGTFSTLCGSSGKDTTSTVLDCNKDFHCEGEDFKDTSDSEDRKTLSRTDNKEIHCTVKDRGLSPAGVSSSKTQVNHSLQEDNSYTCQSVHTRRDSYTQDTAKIQISVTEPLDLTVKVNKGVTPQVKDSASNCHQNIPKDSFSEDKVYTEPKSNIVSDRNSSCTHNDSVASHNVSSESIITKSVITNDCSSKCAFISIGSHCDDITLQVIDSVDKTDIKPIVSEVPDHTNRIDLVGDKDEESQYNRPTRSSCSNSQVQDKSSPRILKTSDRCTAEQQVIDRLDCESKRNLIEDHSPKSSGCEGSSFIEDHTEDTMGHMLSKNTTETGPTPPLTSKRKPKKKPNLTIDLPDNLPALDHTIQNYHGDRAMDSPSSICLQNYMLETIEEVRSADYSLNNSPAVNRCGFRKEKASVQYCLTSQLVRNSP